VTERRAAAAAAILLAALWVPEHAAAAVPLTAEQAMENYREKFEPVAEIDCPHPTDPDEIVVCGRTGQKDPNRLPFESPRVPGEHIAGEPAGAGAFSCLRLCPQPLKVDLIKAAKVGRKIIRHILDPD
jgi:hypothetical protein